MIKILIIIPCYQEQNNITNTIRLVQKVITQIKNMECHILVINDGSKDKSLQQIQNTGVNYLNLPINLGIGGAMQTGYQYAQKNNFDVAIQLDGDGQHKPEYITKLVAPIRNNEANVVIGSRYIDKQGYQSSTLRRTGINYFSWLNQKLVNVKILDATSGFRALDKKAIKIVCNYYPETYPEPESVILYALHNLKLKEVPVKMKARVGGVSSITGLKTLFYMLKVTIGTLFLYIRLKSNKNDSNI